MPPPLFVLYAIYRCLPEESNFKLLYAEPLAPAIVIIGFELRVKAPLELSTW